MTNSREISTDNRAFHSAKVVASHMVNHDSKSYEHAQIVGARHAEKVEE